jgi:hypothetical protein
MTDPFKKIKIKTYVRPWTTVAKKFGQPTNVILKILVPKENNRPIGKN